MNQTIGKLLALVVFRITVPIKELIVGLNTFSVENDGLKYLVESNPSLSLSLSLFFFMRLGPGFLSLEQCMQD